MGAFETGISELSLGAIVMILIGLVLLYLGQMEGALEFVEYPFQVRGEVVAGGAPIGPEVDQDGPLVGGDDDSIAEVGMVDGVDVGVRVLGV